MERNREIELLENTIGNRRYRRFSTAEEANEAAKEMEYGRIIPLHTCFVVTGTTNAKRAADAGLDVTVRV